MQKLSGIIITGNNEQDIEGCIQSLSFCNEIIVVDGGSTDNTVSLAKKLGAIVISGSSNDFSFQRNAGLKKAEGPWILYLDTDERISPQLTESIQYMLLNHPDSFNAYRLKRKNYYFGTHVWPGFEKIERLFQKDALKEWYGKLHESPRVSGKIGDLEGFLLHYSHKDLSSMLKKTNEWSETEALLRFNHHHPPMTGWRFLRILWTGFYDSYIVQRGFSAGTTGLVESIYQSFSLFITYAKLWELQQKKNS